MLKALGIFCLLTALAGLVIHLRTAFITQGGGLDQNPCVAAAAIQVPMMTLLGLAILNQETGLFDFQWWEWVALWFVETVLVTIMASGLGHIAHQIAKNTARR